VVPELALVVGGKVSGRPRLSGTSDVLVVDEVLEGVGRRVGARQSHGREGRGSVPEPLNGGRERGRGELALLALGPPRERRKHDADGSGVPLTQHQVGDEVTGVPAGAEGRGVWANSVQQVSEGGALALGERSAPCC
jgi:hypothetical protein